MREYLSAQADLVGTIRLPNDAFKKNANTEVKVQHVQRVNDGSGVVFTTGTPTRKRLADTRAQVGAPFEYAGRLAGLLRRQDEIESAMDLTKSQVSSHLGAQAPDELPGADLAASLGPACAASG